MLTVTAPSPPCPAQCRDSALVSCYMGLVRDEVLLPSDTLLAGGVAYHLADVWLPELLAAVQGTQLPPELLEQLLQPFVDVLARSAQPTLLNRVMDGVFEPLCVEVEDPSEGEPLSLLPVTEFAERLFDLGAGADVAQRNRDSLYHVHECLCKAERKAQRARAQAAASSAANGTAAAAPAKAKKAKAAARQQLEQQQQAEGEQALDTVVKAQKKKKKKLKPAGEPPAGEQLAPAASSGLQGKRKLQPAEPTLANGTVPAAAAAATAQQRGGGSDKPSAAKKKHRKAQQEAQGSPAGGITANGTGAAPCSGQRGEGPAAGRTPVPVNGKLAGDAKRKLQLAAAAEGAANGVKTPQVVGMGNGQTPGSKKSVRWGLKHNLVLTMGQPVPPQNVRTPPRARPKGSALKESSIAHRLQAASESPKSLKKKKMRAKSQGGAATMFGAGY